jgi:hypothetical protein
MEHILSGETFELIIKIVKGEKNAKEHGIMG